MIYVIEGDTLGAEECRGKVIEIQRNVYGEIHPDIAVSYSSFADVYVSKGNYKNAVENYKSALKIYKAIYGDSNATVAITLQNLGIAYYHLGENKKAVESLQDSLEIFEDIFDDSDPNLIATYQYLGFAFDNLKEYREACKYWHFALQIASHHNNESALSDIYMGLGLNSLSSGSIKVALEYYDRAIAMKSSLFGENSYEAAQIYAQVGYTYLQWNCLPEALKYLQTSYRIFSSLPSNFKINDPYVYITYVGLASVYLMQEDYTKALEYLKMSHPFVLEIYGENSKEELQVGTTFGVIYLKLGEYVKSYETLKDILMRQTTVFGKDHPAVKQTLNFINALYIEANNAGVELPPMEPLMN